MGSIRDPRSTSLFVVTGVAETPEGARVRLDCPPEIAVSFAARVLLASPRFRERPPAFELRAVDRDER